MDIEAGVRTGLAIARKVVNAHGGQVWAENAEDGGVKVGFDLPGAAPAVYV
jgi:signal transduction histidine kinase